MGLTEIFEEVTLHKIICIIIILYNNIKSLKNYIDQEGNVIIRTFNQETLEVIVQSKLY